MNFSSMECSGNSKDVLIIEISEKVALRCSKAFFDNSKVLSTTS